MTASYSFTKLVVRDLEAMCRYYDEVYGLEPMQRVEAEIAGSAIEEVILGREGDDGGLILLRWVDQDPPTDGEVILGFTTTDLDSLVTRAQAAGAAVHVAPFVSEEAGGMRVGFLTDPEGHLAEVVEVPAS